MSLLEVIHMPVETLPLETLPVASTVGFITLEKLHISSLR